MDSYLRTVLINTIKNITAGDVSYTHLHYLPRVSLY